MTRLKRIIAATAVAVTVALAAWLNAPVAAPGDRQPASASRPAVRRLVVLSDPHIDKDDNYRFGRWKPNPGFAEAIAGVNAITPRPDEAVVLGDLSRAAREDDYRKYLKMLEALKVRPVHHMLGNHDEFKPFEKVVLGGPPAQPPADKPAGRHCTAWDFGEHWRIIALDSRRGYLSGGFGDEQIAWFEKQAASAGKRNVLVLSHHDPTSRGGGGVTDAKTFNAALARQPKVRAIFYGHRHEMSFTTHADRVHVVCAPTTSWIFKPRRKRGWLLVTPAEKSLTVEYVPVGEGGYQKPFTRTLTWKE